jgi:hypothetical protein
MEESSEWRKSHDDRGAFPCTAANPAIALYLQSTHPASRVAELYWIVRQPRPVRVLAPYIFIALVAAAIVGYQALAVFGADDFTLTADSYKVFTYGFPFRIVDCSSHLPMHMSACEVAARLAGNFAVFFLSGTITLQVFRRIRVQRKQ